MVPAPNTDAYRAVGGSDDGEISPRYRDNDVTKFSDDSNDNFGDDGMVCVATQPLDLQRQQDRNESRNAERSMRCRFGLSACLLAALVFGGREYYVRNVATDGGGDAAAGKSAVGSDDGGKDSFPYGIFNNGIRGHNNPSSESNDDAIIDEDGELFDDDVTDGLVTKEGPSASAEEEYDDQYGEEDALDLIDGPFGEEEDEQEDDALGGEVEFEGDLDDEIKNGEVGGEEFDSDMDYDDEESQRPDQDDLANEEDEDEEGDVIDEGEGGEGEDEVTDGNSSDESSGDGNVDDQEGSLASSDEDLPEDEELANGQDMEGEASPDEDQTEEDVNNEVDDEEDVEQDEEEGPSDEGTAPEDEEVAEDGQEEEGQDEEPSDEDDIEEESDAGQGEGANEDEEVETLEELAVEDEGEGDQDEDEAEPSDEDVTEEESDEGQGDEEEEELIEEDEEDLSEEEEEDEEGVAAKSEWNPDDDDEEEELPDYFQPLTPDERKQLKERLRETLRTTRDALVLAANPGFQKSTIGHPTPQRTLVLSTEAPKQFMHMHHMKTGGTSVDGLISCALRRQKNLHNGTSINYNRMSECGSMVKRCMEDLATKLNASVVENVFYNDDGQGQFDPADEALDLGVSEMNVCKTSEANVMSYCASLHAVRTFGWKGVDKITVIRDPVDRAWSMYRFSLTGCYHCEEMKDVLKKVLNGTFVGRKGKGDDEDGQNFVYSPNDSCAVQMLGHQGTNMISSVDLYNVANDVRFPRDQEIVAEAVKNLREEFTWIGLTDRIQDSVNGFRTVFPFLAENLSESGTELQDMFQKNGWGDGSGGKISLPNGYDDDTVCKFEHKNAGRDPTCGTKEMDEETIALIKKLSNRDVALYKAAKERFELQLEVLSEYRDGSL